MAGRVNIGDDEIPQPPQPPQPPTPPGVIIFREGTLPPGMPPFQFGIKHLLWAMLLVSIFFGGVSSSAFFQNKWKEVSKPAKVTITSQNFFSLEFDCSVPMYSIVSLEVAKLKLTGKQIDISQTPVGCKLAGVKEWASDKIKIEWKKQLPPWVIIKTIDGGKHCFILDATGKATWSPMPGHLAHL